jgi:hypothetical protein
MFGFTRDELESTGSAERFPIRVENFKKKKKALPLVQHGFWWFVHNCVTHPLIGIFPIKPLFQFHDWTSVKLTAGIPATMTELDELKEFKKQLQKIRDGIAKIDGYSRSRSTAVEHIDHTIFEIDYAIYMKSGLLF